MRRPVLFREILGEFVQPVPGDQRANLVFVGLLLLLFGGALAFGWLGVEVILRLAAAPPVPAVLSSAPFTLSQTIP